MTYNITKSNGDFLVTVQPGDIDEQTTSLRLLGQGVVNYGELVAENFVQLAESFAGPNLPRSPLKGQLWFDTVTNELKVIQNNAPITERVLVSTSGPRYVTSASPATEPVGSAGDLRYFNSDDALRISDGNNWQRVNPIYEGSDPNNTDFPVGTILSAQGSFNRNRQVSVLYNTGDTIEYTATGSASGTSNILAGTWHTRGGIGSGYVLVQRTS